MNRQKGISVWKKTFKAKNLGKIDIAAKLAQMNDVVKS
jgi:hypothetical protein